MTLTYVGIYEFFKPVADPEGFLHFCRNLLWNLGDTFVKQTQDLIPMQLHNNHQHTIYSFKTTVPILSLTFIYTVYRLVGFLTKNIFRRAVSRMVRDFIYMLRKSLKEKENYIRRLVGHEKGKTK